MRLPDPGPHHRRDLPQLLKNTPGLLVLVDTFEQRVQRPTDHEAQQAWYSGKKECHTIKRQIAVAEEPGRIVDVGDSVPGPMADSTVRKASGLRERLPPGTGLLGDSAYQGLGTLHPEGYRPRKKPKGQPRPDEDRAYNRAIARRRITVEHGIGRLRRFAALTTRDRQHRTGHTGRVCAVVGLVNRQRAASPLRWGPGGGYPRSLLRRNSNIENSIYTHEVPTNAHPDLAASQAQASTA